MYCTAVLTLENILWEKYELDPQTWLVVCAHFYSITAVVLDFDLHPHEWFTTYAFSSARMASDRVIWRRALAPFGVSENTSACQTPLSNTQRIVCVCVCARILDTMLGHFDHVMPDLYTYPGHLKYFFTYRTYRNCFFNLLLFDFFLEIHFC